MKFTVVMKTALTLEDPLCHIELRLSLCCVGVGSLRRGIGGRSVSRIAAKVVAGCVDGRRGQLTGGVSLKTNGETLSFGHSFALIDGNTRNCGVMT